MNYWFTRCSAPLIYSISIHFFPISHLLGQSFKCSGILDKLGKASTVSQPYLRHYWFLGTLPENVPKHIVLLFVCLFICFFFTKPETFTTEPVTDAWRDTKSKVLATVCSCYILKIYHCVSSVILLLLSLQSFSESREFSSMGTTYKKSYYSSM